MENEQHNDERVAKMDADQFYTSKGGMYLKGVDIAGQEWEVTISAAAPESGFKPGDPDRIALSFHEIEQKFTLNKTNYLMVKENVGTSDTEAWIGKKIILFGTRDQNPQGEIVDVVRVRPPELQVKRVVPGKSKSKSYDERNPPHLDDEIPFN
jgi:hypothetical protein